MGIYYFKDTCLDFLILEIVSSEASPAPRVPAWPSSEFLVQIHEGVFDLA